MFEGLKGAWGKEKALTYFKRLAAQEPVLKRGNTERVQLTVAGEYPLIIAYNQTLQRMTSRGAPVDWLPLEPAVTQVNPAMIAAKAPHPNAAKLLINYILSEEGQTIIKNVSRVPIRPGVKPKVARLDQSTLKIHYVPADMFKKIADYEKEFRDLFWKQ